MTRILGIDPSLANTGIARITPSGVEHTSTCTTRPYKNPTLTQRAHRLAAICEHVGAHAYVSTLVVVEGPAFRSADPSAFDRAGLWWWLVGDLVSMGDPAVVVVPPAQLKQWATGKGNADKSAVAAAVGRMWPDVDLGSEHEIDALVLAHIGAAKLGLDVPTRAHHAAVLDRITWPDNLPEVTR